MPRRKKVLPPDLSPSVSSNVKAARWRSFSRASWQESFRLSGCIPVRTWAADPEFIFRIRFQFS